VISVIGGTRGATEQAACNKEVGDVLLDRLDEALADDKLPCVATESTVLPEEEG
jgi:hypothetical protein